MKNFEWLFNDFYMLKFLQTYPIGQSQKNCCVVLYR